MLEWRLTAFRTWQAMEDPRWAKVSYPPIDYQDLHYYAAPRRKPGPKSLEEVDPALLKTYEKLGIPLHEQALLAGVEPAEGERLPVAVDAVFDSVSVATTFRKTLAEAGVIFCPISEAVREHPDLVRRYLGSVVPTGDNFFAALIRLCLPMVPLFTCPKGCVALWNCPPISVSMPATRGSSNAR